MTRKLYYEDGYLKKVVAKVERIDGNEVFFDRTIFYPEGGGQPGDRGTFGSWKIEDTIKRNGDVAHVFSSVEGLAPGLEAELVLDWNHRYRFMKCHSAQHLLSAILFHEKDAGTVAVHFGEDAITIELGNKVLSDEELLEVEDSACAAVRRGLSISQRTVLREEAEALHMRRSIKVDSPEVMLVSIDNLDVVACGGVHVKDTSEIGEIAYCGRETIRGHERLVWKVSDQAVNKRRKDSRIAHSVSVLLSSPEDRIVETLEAKLSGLEDLRRENRRLCSLLAQKEAETISGGYHETSLALDDFAPALEKLALSNVFILRVAERPEFLYYGTPAGFDEIKKAISVKGGGRPPLFRGIVLSAVEDVRKFFCVRQ